MTPLVSILIPNFNNGRASSIDGKHDLIGDLLRSLERTLAGDPTPLEIIAYDDGSTDDSRETLRQWSRRTWRGGEPFLELIEAEHCGVLAKTANILSRRARGEFLVRLDGDIECLTPKWAAKLVEIFETAPPRLGVVGPKQLRLDGRIHAMGDWLIHPHGYHHIAAGAERDAVRYPLEVDHVMGCFYCCRKQVFEELGGYDEQFLRGQTIDFGLRARLAGFSCIAHPAIEFIHRHGLRQGRATRADSAEGIRDTIGIFERKWGFSRLAPDLDVVRQRYAGTPLLWHPRWTATEPPESPPDEAPLTAEQTRWADYDRQPQFRATVDAQVQMVMQVAQQLGTRGPVLQVHSGPGLFCSLLAERGLEAVGCDPSAAHVDLARRCVGQRSYPASPPRFETQTDRRHLPLDDGEIQFALLINVLDQHPNPVGLLREVERVLAPGGNALITVRRRRILDYNPADRVHPYQYQELVNQLHHTGAWRMLTDPKQDDPQRDIVVIARSSDAVAKRRSDEGERARGDRRPVVQS